MHSFIPAVLAAALAIQQTSAMVLHLNSLNCQEMSVTFNATRTELMVMPAYAGVTVDNKTQGVRMPTSPPLPTSALSSQDLTMSFTFLFGEPWIVQDGYHNTTITLTQAEDLSQALATFDMPAVQFMGCSDRSTAAIAPTVGQSSSAEAEFNSAYVATASMAETATQAEETATTSYPYSVPYYPASGVPSYVPSVDGEDTTTSDAGVSTAGRIGIAVAVLGAAFLSVLALIACFARRHRLANGTQQTSCEEDGFGQGRTRAHHHVARKWVHDSQELKQLSPPLH